MKVTEDDILDVTEIDLQFAGVLEDRIRSGASIVENLVAIDFDERRESPFPDAVVGQHGGEDGDFQVAQLRGSFGGGGAGESLRAGRDRAREDEHRQQNNGPHDFH